LAQTHPARTTYVESRQGWMLHETGEEIVGIRTFSLFRKGVGTFGLTGMDKLLCFMIVRDLNQFAKLYRMTVTKAVSQFIIGLSGELKPTFQFPPNHQKLYMLAQQKTSKLWGGFLDYVSKIGQAQLVRRQIANELNFACQLDSKILFCALDVMNNTLITDVEAHYRRPDQKAYPAGDLLPDVSSYLEATGMTNPITKIYITSESLDGFPCLMFLFVLSQVTKLHWNHQLNTLVPTQAGNKGNKGLDGAPWVVGVITIMKQFHSSHTHTFLGYLGQYIRANVSASSSKKEQQSLPPTVCKVLLFLEEYCKFSHMSRKAIEAVVPAYLFDRFAHA
jgi:WASH complex subunit strumpellin